MGSVIVSSCRCCMFVCILWQVSMLQSEGCAFSCRPINIRWLKILVGDWNAFHWSSTGRLEIKLTIYGCEIIYNFWVH